MSGYLNKKYGMIHNLLKIFPSLLAQEQKETAYMWLMICLNVQKLKKIA